MSKGPVIVGVDDSSLTAVAVEVAHEIARRYDLPLLYAHVVDGTKGDGRADEALRAVPAAHAAEVTIEYGHPADRLVELSRDRQASFLVLGNHGPRSSILGSISADVARRAACPVVVVPPTVEREAHGTSRSSFDPVGTAA